MEDTIKVVVNRCFGGFGLSEEAMRRYCAESGNADAVDFDLERTDPLLVKIVEEMGSKADGWAAQLRVVEIPADVDWEIDEYDGREHIAEKHRTW